MHMFLHDSCGGFLGRPYVWHARNCYVLTAVLFCPSMAVAGIFGVILMARQWIGFECTVACGVRHDWQLDYHNFRGTCRECAPKLTKHFKELEMDRHF